MWFLYLVAFVVLANLGLFWIKEQHSKEWRNKWGHIIVGIGEQGFRDVSFTFRTCPCSYIGFDISLWTFYGSIVFTVPWKPE